MPEFNPDQLQAIQATNPDLLISAAAGSGKTTVMVERIIQSLIHQKDLRISNMLVITFTRDAARSMKRKLEEGLIKAASGGNPEAALALEEMETAQISTIHAFCRQVIQEGFHVVDVDAQARVCEGNESDRLFDKAYFQAVENVLHSDGGASDCEKRHCVRELMADFSQKDIQTIVRELHTVLMGIPNPLEHLKKAIEQVTLPPEQHPWVREVVLSKVRDLMILPELVEKMVSLAGQAECPDAVRDFVERERDGLDRLSTELEAKGNEISLGDLRSLLIRTIGDGKHSISRRSRTLSDEAAELCERFDKVRKKIFLKEGLLQKCLDELDRMESPQTAEDHIRIRRELEAVGILLEEIEKCFRSEKKAANVIDFSDMEQMTYQLMTDSEHPEVRLSMLERYKAIYVDECQDVSAIQDAIIQSLHGEGTQLFMVGDIKQSIYRFRHAEPALFMEYRDTYQDAEDAPRRRIFFRDNYRSAEPVVDAVNQVFEHSMSRDVNELDYEEGDRLRPNVRGAFGPVDLLLIPEDVEEPETDDDLEAQCFAASEKIRALVEGREGRAYRFSDICILMRSAKTSAPKAVDYFKRMHIPCRYDGAQEYFGLNEVSIFLSLLNVIDNYDQDVELITALKHVPFSMTDEEMARIRTRHPEKNVSFAAAVRLCAELDSDPLGLKCRDFLRQIEAWQLRASVQMPADFLWHLMRETGFYAICGAYPDGRLRQCNLDTLYQKVLDMQKRGILKLRDALTEIRLIRSGEDGGVILRSSGGADNEVRIMTMHGSKGLEFPVVILMDLGKGLSVRGGKPEKICIDMSTAQNQKPLGVYLPAVNQRRHTKRNTCGKTAFQYRTKKNDLAEGTRLLYVAMTRAMEKLVLIGTYKEKDREVWSGRQKENRIWASGSMLDLIMPAVMHTFPDLELREGVCAEKMPWRVEMSLPHAVQEAEFSEPEEEIRRRIARAEATEDWEEMRRAWENAPGEPQSVKTSVSSLVRNEAMKIRFVSEGDMKESRVNKSLPVMRMPAFLLDKDPPVPEFMAEKSMEAAERGTAHHHFLRILDLSAIAKAENVPEELEHQKERLLQEGKISAEEADALELNPMACFFTSELSHRMLQSPHVRREWGFSLRFRDQGATVVQGIIDVLFTEEDHLVILDYKTDHDASREGLIQRHSKQLNWYRKAAEQLTGMRVEELYLVALRTGDVFQVPIVEPDVG